MRLLPCIVAVSTVLAVQVGRVPVIWPDFFVHSRAGRWYVPQGCAASGLGLPGVYAWYGRGFAWIGRDSAGVFGFLRCLMVIAGSMTVVLVDDHSIVREGLKEIIEQTGEFRVVGQASDGEQAVEVVSEVRPDLVLMDVLMPRMDGVMACREIMGRLPDTRVVVLTASQERDAVVEALAAGATGYLQKNTDRERLLSTFRDVAAGELRVPAEVVTRVFADLRLDPHLRDPAARVGLTQREREILSAFVQGPALLGDRAGAFREARHGAQCDLRNSE